MIPIQGYKVDMIPDERPPFERLNRMSLYYLLWANGVENVSDSMPKETLLKFADINKDKLLVLGPNGQFGYRNVSAYKDISGAIIISRPEEHSKVYKELKGEDLAKAIKTKPSNKRVKEGE